jgi:putative protease
VIIEPGEADGLAPLKAGDGVVFDAADWRSPRSLRAGVCSTRCGAGRRIELAFANSAVRFDRIRAGDVVWRTHDPDLVASRGRSPTREVR